MAEEIEQSLLCPNMKRECETSNKNNEEQDHSQNIERESVPNEDFKEDRDPLAHQGPVAISFNILKKEDIIKEEHSLEDEAGVADLQHISSDSECDDTDNTTHDVELSERRVLRSSGLLQKGIPSNSEEISQVSKLGKRYSSGIPKLHHKCEKKSFEESSEGTSKTIYFRNSHSKNFTCDDCHKTYSIFRDLRDHITSVHLRIKNYKCVKCNKMYGWSSNLKRHFCSVGEKVKTTCKFRNGKKQFLDPGYLNKPDIVLRERKFECNDCGVNFFEFSSMKHHINAHQYKKGQEVTGEKLFLYKNNKKIACGNCHMRYSNIYMVKQHISHVHSGVGDYKCVQCSKIFSQSCDLITHIREAHENLKLETGNKFECLVCNKQFSKSVHLKQHSATHRERKFECDDCGIQFFEFTNLKNHINSIHSINRPEAKSVEFSSHNHNKKIACGNCHIRYSNIYMAKQHISQVHSGIADYKCVQCSKIFSWPRDLIMHIWEVHENLNLETLIKIFQCLVCKKQFSNSCLLKQHSAVHREKKFVCDDCGHKFFEFTNLKNHIYFVHYEKQSGTSGKELNSDENIKGLSHDNCDTRYFNERHIRQVNLVNDNYKCVQFNRTFHQSIDLKMHIQEEHKNLKCEVCNNVNKFDYQGFKKKCLKPGNLRLHNIAPEKRNIMCNHCNGKFSPDINTQKYACGNCGMRFFGLSTVNIHIKTCHSGAGSYKCTLCNETFYQPYELKIHACPNYKICKKYKCKVCNAHFPNAGLLALHSFIHKERKYVCADCDKRFSKFYDIKNHIKIIHYKKGSKTSNALNIHKPCKIYACDTCDERYSWSNDLKSHITVAHLGVGYYKCLMCSKLFLKSLRLKTHARSEHKYMESCLDDKIKKYACGNCDKRYSYKREMKDHVRAFHLEMDIYKCDQCKKTYPSISALNKHYASQLHRYFNKLECDICKKKFSNINCVRQHLRVHSRTNVCEYCAKEFSTHHSLRTHTKLVHSKIRNFKCHFCSKKFQLLHHLRSHITCVHQKVKNWVCEQCGDRFFLEHHLRSHVDHIHKGIERNKRPVKYSSKRE